MSLQAVTEDFLGQNDSVRFEDWRGREWGADSAPVTVRFNSPDAIRHFVRSPGELGFGRAYVSGAMDIDGDIWSLLNLQRDLGGIRFAPGQIRGLIKDVGLRTLTQSPPIPPEEVDLGGRLRKHTLARDRKSITHHYDVSNDFYRMVLGPSWTYSCAVFENETDTLEQAQSNKYELICRKLGLEPGMRLLDVGCGWGGMVIHAATHYGVEAVGITISEAQATKARERVAELGLEDRIEIRVQDYRDITDGPFDAISSIGMFEHVGLAYLTRYFEILRGLLTPSGRLLNHQIGRTPMPPIGRIIKKEQVAVARDGFIHRYVFPDGELHEVGDVVGQMQRIGIEARHMESIREHYALTLRHWVDNLEANWDAAVAEVGEGRARVWRLYMAATSVNFAVGQVQVHQILGVKLPKTGAAMGRSRMGLRQRWEYDLSTVGGGDRANHDSRLVDIRERPLSTPQKKRNERRRSPLRRTGS
ncbi:MAG: cyclopropane-fatty-acyl-phospholipid synthase family protein [Actinomycetota bacterium]